MRKENWFLKREGTNKDKVKEFMTELSIDELTAKILLNREIETIEEAKKFLNGDIEDFLNPLDMKDMKKAVIRMKNAIEKGEKITIYGDYDCDGVISTTILYKGLKECGANFNFHIPDRESEGYGMNCDRVKILKEEGTQLIITCDNGIAAFEEIELAMNLGMDVILTDHHDIQLVEKENGEKEFMVPSAYAVVNPHQSDCNYKFKYLCGAGIAFKFILALYKEMNMDMDKAMKLIEFCAIATVCDIVDLKDENRIIVKRGLELLNNSNNIGINALKKACNLEDKKVTAYHLGFVIGPCINATGRLETASLAVELLITENKLRAEELAKELVELNERRKELTERSVEEVIEQIEKEKLYNDKVILVYNSNIHESIAGIVAGRVKERYNLPTIVMTKGKDMPKGSARSIEGYDMFKELSKCKSLMEKFGGHPMAAGLSAKEENLPKIRKMLNDICELTDEDVVPKVRIDAPVLLNQVTVDLVSRIEKLEPFGKSNPSPVLAAKSVLVTGIQTMGTEKTHLKFACLDPNTNKRIPALWFNMADEFQIMFDDKFGIGAFERASAGGSVRFKIDIIYKPSINEFRGNVSTQIIISNLRLSA